MRNTVLGLFDIAGGKWRISTTGKRSLAFA